MIIEISTAELFFDIKNKSHHEVASIQDVNLRYVAEAGTENDHEIYRCITDAEAKIRLMCGKFLMKAEEIGTPPADDTPSDEGATTTIEDAPDTSEENSHDNNLKDDVPTAYRYTFVDNPRRQDNRGRVIANGMHSAIVSMALSKFYISVNQMELSKAHDELAGRSVALLEKMLYEKVQPTQPTWN